MFVYYIADIPHN